MAQHPHPILLFDGVCNLCNGAVQFVIRHDKAARFRFAALQSAAGQALLRAEGLPTADFDSFVLLDGGRAYQRSAAALRVARHLGGLWALLYAAILLPAPLRDAVYGKVAKNRYRWFGKKTACMVPSPELRQRFLA